MKLEWNLDFPVDESLLSLMKSAADQAPLAEGIPYSCFAAVRICDDESIRALNRDYRGLDQSTDVLSFPSVRWPEGRTAGDVPERLKREYDEMMNACFLGDVVISMDHVRAQAAAYGHSEAREAAYLLVHSLCHLMGYDHETPEDAANMEQMQDEILRRLHITRN